MVETNDTLDNIRFYAETIGEAGSKGHADSLLSIRSSTNDSKFEIPFFFFARACRAWNTEAMTIDSLPVVLYIAQSRTTAENQHRGSSQPGT